MNSNVRYPGRISQIGIYLGKLLRMFIYQNDWKTLPMAALIAILVTFAVGSGMFISQEGTLSGCFALVCVCIWNGFFNSIQVVCRERPIVKREHRAGMHISSYIMAHMIYQMLLCAAQVGITIAILMMSNIAFPERGPLSGIFLVDFSISLFLITYAADMLSLLISSYVKTTTTAMTVMPFILIFQLVFSGGLIPLQGPSKSLTNLTIAKWGLQDLCAVSDINSEPMVSLWNTIYQFRNVEIDGQKPVKIITDYVIQNNKVQEFTEQSGSYVQKKEYRYTSENVIGCWVWLIGFTVVFAAGSVIVLESIDKDQR